MPLRASLELLRSSAFLADADADVWTALTIANEMVDTHLASSGLAALTLKHIEAFIACHLYSQGVPDIVRETYAGATFEYSRSASGDDKGLAATKWGQMAMQLDTTGTLRDLTKEPVRIYLI